MKKITRRSILIALLLFLIVAGLLLWKYLTPYTPAEKAESALVSAGGVSVEQNDNWISFEPTVILGTAVIFTPVHWWKRRLMPRWPNGLPLPGIHSI